MLIFLINSIAIITKGYSQISGQKENVFIWQIFYASSGHYHIMTWDVEKVLEVFIASSQQGPDRACPLVEVTNFSLSGVIAQERTIQTRVCVLY